MPLLEVPVGTQSRDTRMTGLWPDSKCVASIHKHNQHAMENVEITDTGDRTNNNYSNHHGRGRLETLMCIVLSHDGGATIHAVVTALLGSP